MTNSIINDINIRILCNNRVSSTGQASTSTAEKQNQGISPSSISLTINNPLA